MLEDENNKAQLRVFLLTIVVVVAILVDRYDLIP